MAASLGRMACAENWVEALFLRMKSLRAPNSACRRPYSAGAAYFRKRFFW